jgi:hypothetical protein
MIAEIGAAYSGLKTAYDIAKGLNATVTKVQINEIKIALQQHIMDAREALDVARETEAASARRIADLEQQIVRLKDWEAQKQRYQLTEISNGVFAHMLKSAVETGEPRHCLCTNCFQHGKPSTLQAEQSYGVDTLSCPLCKTAVKVSHKHPNYPYVRPHQASF